MVSGMVIRRLGQVCNPLYGWHDIIMYMSYIVNITKCCVYWYVVV